MPEGAISPYDQFLGGCQYCTNATRITIQPRFDRANEWRQTKSAVVEGGCTLNEPKTYDIAMFGSPERKKASGIDGGREKEDTHQTHPKVQHHHDSAA